MEQNIEIKKKNNKDKYYCYLICSSNPNFLNCTYNGSTNNLVRRLRQHNEEIVGGAKATRGKGPWIYIGVWEGFSSHKEALSCEWRIKHPTNSRKRPSQYNGVKGRIKSLNLLTKLDNWTNKSTGMGKMIFNYYYLYVDKELIKLIDIDNKKSNLEIKLLDDLFIKLKLMNNL
jgi:predicted GIY-YIG superfamily endonuclease